MEESDIRCLKCFHKLRWHRKEEGARKNGTCYCSAIIFREMERCLCAKSQSEVLMDQPTR